MFNQVKKLKGCMLDGLDGEIGDVREFYFDDRYWAIRYLVADTGNWLKGRQVLISPYALAAAIDEQQPIAIGLTQKQIEDSPLLNNDMPVSRQFEEAYYGYYGWPAYWSGEYLWGPCPNLVRERGNWQESAQAAKPCDLHLHSTADVYSCHIQAEHGEIGNVDDMIIEDETWTIRYLIVDTRKWWPGKKVLVSPQWIKRVDWGDSNVLVNLPSEIPEYDAVHHNHPPYKTRLHSRELHENY